MVRISSSMRRAPRNHHYSAPFCNGCEGKSRTETQGAMRLLLLPVIESLEVGRDLPAAVAEAAQCRAGRGSVPASVPEGEGRRLFQLFSALLGPQDGRDRGSGRIAVDAPGA